MKKTVRVFKSFAEAERAKKEDYRALSPSERIEILLSLIARQGGKSDGSTEGFKRVYRIAKRT